MQRLKNILNQMRLQLILTLFVVLIILLMMANDYLASLIFNQSYYFKESLLFKTPIILLLIPVIFYTSFNQLEYSKEIDVIKVVSFLIPITILHVFVASYTIQFISLNFLDSPFTFEYLVKHKFTQDFVFILTTYGLMYLIARYYYLNSNRSDNNVTLSIKTGTRVDIIDAIDIDWIGAETPYIALWLDDKKYLYHSTLTDILIELDNPDYIRIHKSTIVNTKKISAITSRLNGDYDIKLYNNVTLRLSRTYRTKKVDSQLKI